MADHERGRRKDGGNTVEGMETGGKALIDHSSAPLPSPVITSPVFNPDTYSHHVAHFDMPDDKKAELLFAVWQIMRSFVDRAFGDDPVQLAVKARHVDALDAKDETAAPGVVSSSHKQTHAYQHDLTSAFQPSAAGRRGEEDSTA
jgi:hypothetical protein